METEKYPYGVGIVTNGSVMHVRREYLTLGGLIDGYRAMLKLYSRNPFVKPIPFEKHGKERKQRRDIVSKVEAGMLTERILESIKNELWSRRLERHYNN